jgi:hypothetical protein
MITIFNSKAHLNLNGEDLFIFFINYLSQNLLKILKTPIHKKKTFCLRRFYLFPPKSQSSEFFFLGHIKWNKNWRFRQEHGASWRCRGWGQRCSKDVFGRSLRYRRRANGLFNLLIFILNGFWLLTIIFILNRFYLDLFDFRWILIDLICRLNSVSYYCEKFCRILKGFNFCGKR